MSNKKIGLICDLEYSHHILFKNYYHALKFIFNDIKLIKNINDVFNIDLLIIANDHFESHKNIWKSDIFIDKINNLNLNVVVFSTEKIMDSSFPWNLDNQKNIEKFNNLYQYVLVDDIDKLNKKHHRCLISKYYNNVIKEYTKINKCVFIGNTNGYGYSDRIKTLSEINKIIPVDIISSKQDNWYNYIETLSKYRFVFSPIGNMDGFTLRFYESLLIKSIPIQQIKPEILNKYKVESTFDDCIYFYNIEELPDKIKNFKLTEAHNELWLEDHIYDLLKNDNLL